MISIIIPTYNSETTLKRCLNSIISQTFTNFEVLIIDGASKDKTLAIAERFNDRRIKIFSEPDKGVYDAMNKGIRLAKGGWIYFLGSDDTLYNEIILANIYSAILSTKSKILYGNVKVCGNTRWAVDGTIYDGYFSLQKLISKNICHQAIFYNKSIFSKIGNYKTNFIVLADWDFNLRCRAKFQFEYIDLIVANFYSGGISGKEKEIKFTPFECVLKYYKWQFYKNDLRENHIIFLKYTIKKRKIGNFFLICPQILISNFIQLISRLKNHPTLNEVLIDKKITGK